MSYRLLSFQIGRGARAGLLVDGKVYDGARVTGKPAWSSVLGALRDWAKATRVSPLSPNASPRPRRKGVRSRGEAPGTRCFTPAHLLRGANYYRPYWPRWRAPRQGAGPTMKTG